MLVYLQQPPNIYLAGKVESKIFRVVHANTFDVAVIVEIERWQIL